MSETVLHALTNLLGEMIEVSSSSQYEGQTSPIRGTVRAIVPSDQKHTVFTLLLEQPDTSSPWERERQPGDRPFDIAIVSIDHYAVISKLVFADGWWQPQREVAARAKQATDAAVTAEREARHATWKYALDKLRTFLGEITEDEHTLAKEAPKWLAIVAGEP